MEVGLLVDVELDHAASCYFANELDPWDKSSVDRGEV